jgi:hypothetical protein
MKNARSTLFEPIAKGNPMNKTRFFRGVASLCAMITLSFSLGCGTILYPERRGQRTHARVDTGVAVMDACWILLGVIPGVIAFVVDFGNGAIYLPGGAVGANSLKVVQTPTARPDSASIERAVQQQTGLVIRLSDPTLVWRKLASREDIEPSIAAARQDRPGAL